MSDKPIIIDEPDKIRAVGMLSIYYKLKLEAEHPGGPTWSMNPAVHARKTLLDAGKPNPGRLKMDVLKAYEAYLQEIGVLRLVLCRPG